MIPIDNNIAVTMVTNPNYMTFWFFWGMVGIATLIKLWNPLMRYRYRLEGKRLNKEMSDKDLQKQYRIMEEVHNEMLKDYPNHKRDDYEIDLQKEYFKRFGTYEIPKTEKVE